MPNLLTPTEEELRKMHTKENYKPYFCMPTFNEEIVPQKITLHRGICETCGEDTGLGFVDDIEAKLHKHEVDNNHFHYQRFRWDIFPQTKKIEVHSWGETR
jgi:hypothetical protein